MSTYAGPTVHPIPTTRLVRVELRKMVDTRAGTWLLVSIGGLAALATGAVVVVAPDDHVSYSLFATAVGLPMSVVLPVLAILAVTSEWSQRSGLTTFTLVPWRGRVVGAKAIATVVVGVVSMVLALAVGAVGNLVYSALAGVDAVWDVPLAATPQIVLGNLVGMAIGFTLGVVLRASAPAVVGYFVVSFVLPGLLQLLATTQQRFADVQPWVDWNLTQAALLDGTTDTVAEWSQLASTTALWIVAPLLAGLLALRRTDLG